MEIKLITPSAGQIINGNKITALRISHILEQIGHKVTVTECYEGKFCHLMIALHALHSFASIAQFHKQHPELPIVLVLTGTDLYSHIKTSLTAQQSLEMATRLVVLQQRGLAELPTHLQAKTRVIYQSVEKVVLKPSRSENEFKIAVIANLRAEKDPFRTAIAVRDLPASSQAKVIHIGHALNAEMEEWALAENIRNHRYQWIGTCSYQQTRQILASSHLLAITSLMEGSSNVLGEAIASAVPVVASQISGLMGTLGEDYPGYFPMGNTTALTSLLHKAETDIEFYQQLQAACASITSLIDPERERRGWQQLLAEIS
jgi:putative glycosyltransferase (TIGR04348 family)